MFIKNSEGYLNELRLHQKYQKNFEHLYEYQVSMSNDNTQYDEATIAICELLLRFKFGTLDILSKAVHLQPAELKTLLDRLCQANIINSFTLMDNIRIEMTDEDMKEALIVYCLDYQGKTIAESSDFETAINWSPYSVTHFGPKMVGKFLMTFAFYIQLNNQGVESFEPFIKVSLAGKTVPLDFAVKYKGHTFIGENVLPNEPILSQERINHFAMLTMKQFPGDKQKAKQNNTYRKVFPLDDNAPKLLFVVDELSQIKGIVETVINRSDMPLDSLRFLVLSKTTQDDKIHLHKPFEKEKDGKITLAVRAEKL